MEFRSLLLVLSFNTQLKNMLNFEYGYNDVEKLTRSHKLADKILNMFMILSSKCAEGEI
jgi:hypothetical protein